MSSQSDEKSKLPDRDEFGSLIFEGLPDFKPNLTPKEILQVSH